MKILFLLAALIIFFTGCTPKISENFTAPINQDSTISVNISEGEQLFAVNCSKCHDLRDPGAYTAEQWNEIIPRMQKQYGYDIDGETEGKILEYLLANAKQ